MADYIRQRNIVNLLQSANCRLYNLLQDIKKEDDIRYQWSAILSIERDIGLAKTEYNNEFFTKGELYD